MALSPLAKKSLTLGAFTLMCYLGVVYRIEGWRAEQQAAIDERRRRADAAAKRGPGPSQ
ncbi:Small integral membrane protein 8 [Plasmodiophora brassicae]|uniref:Uncharacterized protein n=1 Tax=Plasmodiophora brassicae TaxID=37360 RepID=A0A0G4J773_PLABS|nr:hypothetical protein PBRA_003200 [Plasmodiophora brassicae]